MSAMPASSVSTVTARTPREVLSAVETRFILEAVRSEGADEKRLQEFTDNGLDWKKVEEAASYHGVFPLVFQAARSIRESINPVEWDRLERTHHLDVWRSLFMSSELIKLVRLLEDRDIPCIPLKGPALAESLYGGIGMRQSGDLDLLIRRQDLGRAVATLRSEGFSPVHVFTPRQQRGFIENFCGLPFRHHTNSLIVDLHWRYFPAHVPLRLDSEVAFEKATEVPLAGVRVRGLPPDHLIVYLCFHGASHAWSRLVHICDVARTLRHSSDMDWQTLLTGAKRCGAAKFLLLAVILVEETLGLEVSPRREHARRDNLDLRQLAGTLRERLFKSIDREPGQGETNPLLMRLLDSPSDRLRFAIRRAFTPSPEDWSATHLPDSLYRLYHVLRPLRLSAILLKTRFEKVVE